MLPRNSLILSKNSSNTFVRVDLWEAQDTSQVSLTELNLQNVSPAGFALTSQSFSCFTQVPGVAIGSLNPAGPELQSPSQLHNSGICSFPPLRQPLWYTAWSFPFLDSPVLCHDLQRTHTQTFGNLSTTTSTFPVSCPEDSRHFSCPKLWARHSGNHAVLGLQIRKLFPGRKQGQSWGSFHEFQDHRPLAQNQKELPRIMVFYGRTSYSITAKSSSCSQSAF